MSAPPTILSFTQFDPTGAAGALGDALTCASMGCHLACATTQWLIPDGSQAEAAAAAPEWLERQARAILRDMPVAAFKVGPPGSAQNVRAIAEIVADHRDVPVVLHPGAVEPPAAGAASAAVWQSMRDLLLPQTTVLAISLAAARAWTAKQDEDEIDLPAADCARRLLDWGARCVLVTRAAQVDEHVVNILFRPDEPPQHESQQRIDLTFRGAGETLAAAIAALLAQGLEPADAVREANDYLGQTLAGGFRIGTGAAMPDRLFWASEDEPGPEEEES
jgi:hydroxymethylpyrimidine/phosphomethylpyrimidine kinase